MVRLMLAAAMLLGLGLMSSCGKADDSSKGAAAPTSAGETPGAAQPEGGEATTDPGAAADPPATGGGATGAEPASPSIAALCDYVAECGCPEPGCVDTFNGLALPAEIVDCFAAQPCDAVCDPNAGDPDSPLLTACMKQGGAAGGSKACARASDCPATHDCCSGFCYQQGTPMWQTQCQRPSGSF